MTSSKEVNWTLVIEDPKKLIDRNEIGLGSTFNIAVGRNVRGNDQYIDMIHGFCKTVETVRGDTGIVTYAFSGRDNIIKASRKLKVKQARQQEK